MNGQYQRENISDNDNVLDFSVLFGAGNHGNSVDCTDVSEVLRALDDEEADKTEMPLRKPQDDSESEQVMSLYRQHQLREADKKRVAEIFRVYQRNIRESERLQREIIQGVREGASPYNLFLQAVRMISHMTGNPLFYKQVEEDAIKAYGGGKYAADVAAGQLKETEERLQNMRKALESEHEDGARRRILNAIQEHEERRDELQQIQQAAGE